MMNTRAAVLYETCSPLVVEEIQLPRLKPGQVLVDMAYSGVCHTQLLEVNGKRGPDRYLPHCLGHEGSGVVLDVGPTVEKVSPGDRVVLSWIKGSGSDVPSTIYQSGESKINSGAISTFMEHTITCENRVTLIDERMPLKEAALLGCAIPTGAGAIFNTEGIRPGSHVAIFGIGGVGISAVMASKLMNCTMVIGVDIVEAKLAEAKRFGATHIINALTEDPLEAILEITSGAGVDFAVEAVGNQRTMELAFRCVRERGGVCILAGNLPHGGKVSIDPFDLINGRRIIGTFGGETQPDRDIPLYAELYLNGKLDLSSMISRIFSLDQINDALSDLERGAVVRGLLDLNG